MKNPGHRDFFFGRKSRVPGFFGFFFGRKFFGHCAPDQNIEWHPNEGRLWHPWGGGEEFAVLSCRGKNWAFLRIKKGGYIGFSNCHILVTCGHEGGVPPFLGQIVVT